MARTEITRRQYGRGGLRHASDLTDREWARIAPHLPVRKLVGRPAAGLAARFSAGLGGAGVVKNPDLLGARKLST